MRQHKISFTGNNNYKITNFAAATVAEVERRGKSEVGIYRISGSKIDLEKLKKTFETNPIDAEQLIKVH